MPILAYEVGDLFVYRVIKHHENNPDRKWANTYEFRATEAGGETELLLLSDALVGWEKAMHMVAVEFDRFTISTWEADSKPYDPLTFVSSTITGNGAVGEVNGMLPINNCLNVTRVAATGRFGHIFLRGALDGAEVDVPAGVYTLQDTGDIQTRITTALTSSNLADFIGAAPDGSLSMVMVSKDGSQVRTIAGLFAGGVSQLPTDHAWFNRTTTP